MSFESEVVEMFELTGKRIDELEEKVNTQQEAINEILDKMLKIVEVMQ